MMTQFICEHRTLIQRGPREYKLPGSLQTIYGRQQFSHRTGEEGSSPVFQTRLASILPEGSDSKSLRFWGHVMPCVNCVPLYFTCRSPEKVAQCDDIQRQDLCEVIRCRGGHEGGVLMTRLVPLPESFLSLSLYTHTHTHTEREGNVSIYKIDATYEPGIGPL